jgi:glyoxylase-like metal-dependent hydrolase (beta-lactamase superfamily II)
MGMAVLIDLHHLGNPHVIAAYLLTGDEPALVDCGPAVCVEALEHGLAKEGLALVDVRHLVLTHIHLDHAGAAGTLVRRHPELLVHVSDVGAPHLVDPTRLERSARRLYEAKFDRLFGEILPVPEANVHVLGSRILDLEVVPTPGHAWHHVAFFDTEGACYPGDALGSAIPPGNFVYPAAAPPEIDLEAWERSFEAIEQRAPNVLRLPHFGEVGEPVAHIEKTRERLHSWAARVEGGAGVAEFLDSVHREFDAEAGPERDLYGQLPGFELTYAGIKRYFDTRRGS